VDIRGIEPGTFLPRSEQHRLVNFTYLFFCFLQKIEVQGILPISCLINDCNQNLPFSQHLIIHPNSNLKTFLQNRNEVNVMKLTGHHKTEFCCVCTHHVYFVHDPLLCPLNPQFLRCYDALKIVRHLNSTCVPFTF